MPVALALLAILALPALAAGARNAYVTNFDDTVSQFDVGAGGALAAKSPATVPAGNAPRGVAVSPDGKSAYVVNSIASGTVSQFDVGAGGALAAQSPATVAAGVAQQGVAVGRDGKSVYVAVQGGGGTVSQYDVGAGGALVPKSPPTVTTGSIGGFGRGPRGIAVNPDGTSAYVANFNPDAFEGLTLKLSKRLKGAKRNKLKAKLRCEKDGGGPLFTAVDCAATLSGNVRVKIGGRASAAARPIKPRSADLAAGKQKTFKLKVTRQGRSALKHALRRGHKVKAKVRAKATDVFDNVEKAKAKVRLR